MEEYTNDDPRTIYSEAQLDRSGASIEGMLHAHAYAFQHNLTYGGACLTALTGRQRAAVYKDIAERRRTGKPYNPIPGYDAFDQRLDLIDALNLGDILKFACPSRNNSFAILPHETFWNNKPKETPAWRAYIQSFTSKAEIVPVDDNVFRVAVHVRRGDVTPCHGTTSRYFPNQHYLRMIEQILLERSNTEHQPQVEVHIYSESKSFEPWDDFVAKNYTMHLDTSVVDVWKQLLSADVVISSRSSFSLVPASLTTRGTVLYTPKLKLHKRHPSRRRRLRLAHFVQVSDSMIRQAQEEMEALVEACEEDLRTNHTRWEESSSSEWSFHSIIGKATRDDWTRRLLQTLHVASDRLGGTSSGGPPK